MSRITIFLIVLYLIFFAGGWWLLSGNMHALGTTKSTLATTEQTLKVRDTEFADLRAENEALKQKLASAQTNASFRSLRSPFAPHSKLAKTHSV